MYPSIIFIFLLKLYLTFGLVIRALYYTETLIYEEWLHGLDVEVRLTRVIAWFLSNGFVIMSKSKHDDGQKQNLDKTSVLFYTRNEMTVTLN